MNKETSTTAATKAKEFRTTFDKIKTEISRIMVGQEEVIDGVLTALMAGGHVLLEGVPGLGKTMLIRSLGEALDLKFSRIQFTPDMMPADIQGTSILVEKDSRGARGPVSRRPAGVQSRPRRRDQSRHPENPERAARGHAGKTADGRQRAPSSWRSRTV